MTAPEHTGALFLRVRPITWRSVLAWAALTALAYLGNVGRIPLFFNVDFLFGTVFVFLTLHFFGWGPGLLTALIAASHTAVLWHHPYAAAILVLEALIVGTLYRRRTGNLMLLVMLYWMLVGMPLVMLFYRGVMGVAFGSTVLVALKQAINGVVNALLAALLITVIQQMRPGIERPARRAPLAFAQVMFLLMVAFVLVPAMVILVVTARQEMSRVEGDVQAKLQLTAFSTRQAVNAWVAENLQSLRSLATYASVESGADLRLLRNEMTLLKMSNPDFAAMAVVDPRGRVILGDPRAAAYPLTDADVVGGPFFDRLTATLAGSASDVIIHPEGRTMVLLGVPIVERDTLAGAVIGAVDPSRLRDLLQRLSGNWAVSATIVDGTGLVIASTTPGVAPYSGYQNRLPSPGQHYRSNLFLRVPELARNVSIMRRWQDSEYVAFDQLGQFSAWSLVLEAPVAPYQDALNARYQSMMLLMLLIIVGTILLSAAVSRRILSSLTQLTAVTENLPDKVVRQEELEWPESTINEIDSLIRCFRETSAHLAGSFRELQVANRQLLSAKTEAEAANRAKTEFLANISHDLRTPLNGILGYAQILARDGSLDDRTREAVSIIERSGNHLLNLINDILDVSRIEADKLTLSLRPFELGGLLEDITDIVSLHARRKGLALSAEIAEGLPQVVVGDEKRLRQVLLNLLNNAVKFTDQGTIAFRVGTDHGRFRFEVQDTGIGIPEGQLAEIFSPFKQLTKHVQSEEGTGLGLAIVKRLVDMMDGRVEVESEPGQGSCFRVTVLLPESDEAPERSAEELPSGYKGRRRTILVVDDKVENRSVLLGTLEPIGFRVLEATDGEEGLASIRTERPDLVFLDLVMPRIDGFDAVRAIRSNPDLDGIRVVAISASVAETIRSECLRIGFDDFLPKPFRQADLLESIRRLIGVEWVTRTRQAEPTEAAQEASPPSLERIDDLIAIVATGNIRSIVAAAERLGEDPATSSFAERVIGLAQEFQINRLTDFLNHARSGTLPAGERPDEP